MARTGAAAIMRSRLIVLALLLLGAGLRLAALGDVPPGLYHDEAFNGLDALRVIKEGDFPLYFPANNGREPLFIYLIAASVSVLGRSPLAVRLPSFFVGFLTLAATYDLARVLFNRRVGRWTLAVLAVTFWHVHLSRMGFRAVLLPLFTALFLAQAVRGVKTGRARHWLAAGALYGGMWYTYMAARFTPIALGAVLLATLVTRREARIHWRGGALFCAAALLVLAPLGVYTLQHPDIVLARTGQVTIFSPEINGGDLWGTLLRHVWNIAAMFFIRGDRIWRHNLAWRPVWDPALGVAFVMGVGVALGGIFSAAAQRRRDAGEVNLPSFSFAVILLWTAVMALPTLLAEDAPHFLRGVGVLPTAALFPALGLAWIESRVTPRLLPITPYPSPITPHPLHFTSYVSCITQYAARHTSIILLCVGLFFTTHDYFFTYARAPLAYHWLEGGAVDLAGALNAARGAGWDGARMLHGPDNGRVLLVDRVLWESWEALPFLVPEERVTFLPLETPPALDKGLTFAVWPYRDWQAEVFSLIARPAYLSVRSGPQVQGDKDPAPYTAALLITADARPPVPEAIARFGAANGEILLRAALVRSDAGGSTVRLWWDCVTPLAADYTVYVHYLRDGELLTQHDMPPGEGHLPTSHWSPGDLILDEHFLPAVIPDPARDTLRVGLYRSDTGEPLGTWIEVGVIVESDGARRR
ncbi:MAG TPA: glycosyltransferase family 39 protein [Anaerolineae bacterium]|nr:glycosyltransferase family 39 protein [Anaerolineae bacterium]